MSTFTYLLAIAVAATGLGCDEKSASQIGDAARPSDAQSGALVSVPARIEALSAAPGDPEALYLGVWAAAADDVFFAGGVRGGDGVLGHFDGAEIRRLSIPAGPALWWVWGADARHIWVVGEAGRVLGWGDRRWRREPTDLPKTAVLWGVWGSGPSDVWAVGGSMRPGGPKGLLIRSVGDGRWRRVEDPALPEATNLFKVWGRSATEVHLVGEGGVAVYYDGTTYRRVETGTTARLLTVHGHPNGLTLAVGGTNSAVILRFVDGRWIDDQPPRGLPPLSGVFVDASGWAIATGDRGTVLSRSIEGEWTRHSDLAQALDLQRDTLHAVWSGANLWTVGGALDDGIGRILTDLRPAPTQDPAPPVAPDGGVADAALLPDAGPDGARPDAAPAPDAARPDAARPDAAAAEDAALDAAAPDADAPIGRCGDGRIDPNETCDDANLDDDDGCDSACQIECGNGTVQAFEQCDDGNRATGDGCNANCLFECGNGQLDENETCDDGNRASGDGCDATCLFECGNGRLDGRETCDDGGVLSGDGCAADCQLECGDGVLDALEACDDGNRRDGDGCDASCALEARPEAGEPCPQFICAEDLECWGIAAAGFLNICTLPCQAVEDCTGAFGPEVCCQRPGPQLLDTYCVPLALTDGACN